MKWRTRLLPCCIIYKTFLLCIFWYGQCGALNFLHAKTATNYVCK